LTQPNDLQQSFSRALHMEVFRKNVLELAFIKKIPIIIYQY